MRLLAGIFSNVARQLTTGSIPAGTAGNTRLADGAAADALTRTVSAGVRVAEGVSGDDPVEAEVKVYDELEAAAVTAGVDAVAAEGLLGVAAGDVPADAVVAGLVTAGDAAMVVTGDAAMIAAGDVGTAGLAGTVAAGVVAADTGGEVATGAGVTAAGGDVTPAVAVGELTRMGGGGGERASKLEGEGDAYGDGTCTAIQQTMTSAKDAIEGIIRVCYALAAACS